MNKKNKFISVSSILSLLICMFAAIVVWLFAKYNAQTPDATALVYDAFNLIA